MDDIIQRLAALEKKELGIILDAVFDGPEGRSTLAFLQYLKSWPPESRKALMAKLPLQTAQWVEERLVDVAPAGEGQAGKMERKLIHLWERLPSMVKKMEAATRRAAKRIARNRELLRSHFTSLGKIVSDQQKGLPRGDLHKPAPSGAEVFNLPSPDSVKPVFPDISECIRKRQSRRKFTKEPLTMGELSYLLWATQGVRKVLGGGRTALRYVPSGGNMHPLETYVAVNRVEGLKPGLYRYLPLDHKLVLLFTIKNQAKALSRAALGQDFVGDCGAVFIWSAIPYRSEWRYTIEAAKLVLLDAGHVCQNLYLACEALGLGTCAIGAYDQKRFDSLCKLDGVDEMVVYLAPVGRA
jgi:SagB-type dehydrogenase family enzyme